VTNQTKTLDAQKGSPIGQWSQL